MGWILSFIPGGQVLGILSAIGSAIAALVKALFEAVSVALANPVVFLIVALGFGGGFWEGLRWQQAKVDAAKAEVAAVHKQWKSANDRNTNDLADAMLARQKAEDMARGFEKASREASIRAARAADAERVRKPSVAPAPAAPASASGWGVPGLPALFGKD